MSQWKVGKKTTYFALNCYAVIIPGIKAGSMRNAISWTTLVLVRVELEKVADGDLLIQDFLKQEEVPLDFF